MIKYQIGQTGKTVLITFEQWLNLTDEDIQEMVAANSGMSVDDPFSDFFMKEVTYESPDLSIEDIPDDIKKEIEDDLKSE